MRRRRNRRARVPWIMRLPPGLRDRPAWVYIGFLVGMSGLTYAFGLSQSMVSQAIGPTGLRIWGAILTIAGFAVSYATITARHALERLALRIFSICILVYCGYVLSVADIRRTAMTAVLSLGLVIAAEIRVASLKALFDVADKRQL